MKPQEGLTYIPDVSYLRPDLIVTDAIYSPEETELLRLAKTAGCKTMNGKGMMLFQGAASFRLWTGLDMPIEHMKDFNKDRTIFDHTPVKSPDRAASCAPHTGSGILRDHDTFLRNLCGASCRITCDERRAKAPTVLYTVGSSCRFPSSYRMRAAGMDTRS